MLIVLCMLCYNLIKLIYTIDRHHNISKTQNMSNNKEESTFVNKVTSIHDETSMFIRKTPFAYRKCLSSTSCTTTTYKRNKQSKPRKITPSQIDHHETNYHSSVYYKNSGKYQISSKDSTRSVLGPKAYIYIQVTKLSSIRQQSPSYQPSDSNYGKC